MENLNPRERRRRKDWTGTHGKRVGSDTLTLAHLSLFPDIILPRRLVHAIVEVVGQVGARLPPRFLFERVEVEVEQVVAVGVFDREGVDVKGRVRVRVEVEGDEGTVRDRGGNGGGGFRPLFPFSGCGDSTVDDLSSKSSCRSFVRCGHVRLRRSERDGGRRAGGGGAVERGILGRGRWGGSSRRRRRGCVRVQCLVIGEVLGKRERERAQLTLCRRSSCCCCCRGDWTTRKRTPRSTRPSQCVSVLRKRNRFEP